MSLLRINLIVRRSFNPNVFKFSSVDSRDLEESFSRFRPPALELQPGERLWDPAEDLIILTDLTLTHSLAQQDDGQHQGRGGDRQLGPVGHQGGEEGSGDGGQGVTEHQAHDGDSPVVDATVLEGEEAGQVEDCVVREAGRESEEAEQGD